MAVGIYATGRCLRNCGCGSWRKRRRLLFGCRPNDWVHDQNRPFHLYQIQQTCKSNVECPDGASHPSPGQRPGCSMKHTPAAPCKGAAYPGRPARDETCGTLTGCVVYCAVSQGCTPGWYAPPFQGGDDVGHAPGRTARHAIRFTLKQFFCIKRK